MLSGLLDLEELNLSCNKLKKIKIPSNPEVLKKLKTLDLSMNEIKRVPKELGRLTALKCLDVQQNPVAEVPDNLIFSMNDFLHDPSKDTSSTECDSGDQNKSRRMQSSAIDARYGVRKTFLHKPVKQLSLTRVTQNTAPMDEHVDAF